MNQSTARHTYKYTYSPLITLNPPAKKICAPANRPATTGGTSVHLYSEPQHYRKPVKRRPPQQPGMHFLTKRLKLKIVEIVAYGGIYAPVLEV